MCVWVLVLAAIRTEARSAEVRGRAQRQDCLVVEWEWEWGVSTARVYASVLYLHMQPNNLVLSPLTMY